MRKVIWSCAACGLLFAGVLVWLAGDAVRHPDTLLGRVLTGVTRTVVLVNPTTGVAPVVARQVWHTRATLGGEDVQEPAADELAPADPVAAPEEPARAALDVVVPPVVVIPDEEPAVEAVAGAASDLSTFPSPDGKSELTVAPNACPRAMVYCTDADPADAIPMPAEEDGAEKLSVAPREIAGSCEAECPVAGCCRKACCGTGCCPMACGAKAACARDCPDQGCCEKGDCKKNCTCKGEGVKAESCHDEDDLVRQAVEDGEACEAGVEEEQEAAGEICPAYPVRDCTPKAVPESETRLVPRGPAEIDTMEYRPSDGNLNNFGPGPL